MKNEELNKKIAEKILGWEITEEAWFDQNCHYKEDRLDFNPTSNLDDAFYVLDKVCESVQMHKTEENKYEIQIVARIGTEHLCFRDTQRDLIDALRNFFFQYINAM